MQTCFSFSIVYIKYKVNSLLSRESRLSRLCTSLGQRTYSVALFLSFSISVNPKTLVYPFRCIKALCIWRAMLDPMDLLRSNLSRVRIPEPTNRIYKQECCISFDTPVTSILSVCLFELEEQSNLLCRSLPLLHALYSRFFTKYWDAQCYFNFVAFHNFVFQALFAGGILICVLKLLCDAGPESRVVCLIV